MEVWLGYRSGRVYLAEQFHDGKISEEDFRTRLALIGKQAFDEAERRRQAGPPPPPISRLPYALGDADDHQRDKTRRPRFR